MGACYVFRRLAGAGATDNTIALILYSIPMMAAALGRCDSGHVLANGEGILIATTFYLSNTRRVWRWYSAAFVLIFIAFPAAEVVWVDKPLFVRLGLDTLSEGNSNSPVSNALFRLGQRYINIAVKPARQAQLERTLENARRGGVPPVIEFPAVYPGWHGGFLAPFGYRPNGIGTYFSSDIDFGYYDGLENALTEAAIARKVAEMKDHPHKALLLPDQFADLCRVNMDAERHQISMLMEFPYLAKAAHPDSIDAPLCGFILERYRQQDEAAAGNFGYAVWVAKADPAHD
jgi:hypothetical protein